MQNKFQLARKGNPRLLGGDDDVANFMLLGCFHGVLEVVYKVVDVFKAY